MATAHPTLLCLACYGDRLATVSENADVCRLFELKNDQIYPAGLLSLPSKDPMDRTSAILACGVSFFVCGAICVREQARLEKGGVTVFPWLSGSIDEVLDAFQGGTLATLVMPGCQRLVGLQGRGRGKRDNGRQQSGRRQRQGRSRRDTPPPTSAI